MNNLIPTTLRFRVNETTVEVCHGDIPDIFGQLQYDPIKELELPDTKVSDEEFQDWLSLYRCSGGWFKHRLLKESQCN